MTSTKWMALSIAVGWFGVGSAVEAIFPIGRAVRMAVAGLAAVLLMAGMASAHDCPCPPGCVPTGSPTPAPSVVPTPKPTAAAEKCPPGTPLLNLGTSITRVVPAGAKLIYCTRVQLATPPARLIWSFYETRDQDCGNLKLTVRQLASAKQTKSSGPMSNGSVQLTKRIGQGEDPSRVANGDYILEYEGFPANCTNYLLSAGAQ